MGFIVKAVKSVVKAVVGVASKIVNTIVGPIVGLFKPKKAAKASSNLRLSKSLEPEAYRKIVFGRTAAGLDLRFWQVWGAKGTNFDEILANATHRLNAYKELYFEDELAIDGNGNVMPAWAGVVSREVRRGIPGEAGMYAGGGGLWNPVSAPFTGVAHMKLAWVPTDAKLPNGVPSRYTQIVEGALVYDPRRDSTVTGGSGSHRINDQSTWEYAPLDAYGQPIGRNNALQVLWYLLGWRITNPATGEAILVAGRGVDPTDINLATFINAANDAEAAGYYTDLILSTEDSHTSNEDKLTAGGLIGQLIDTGGLWSYHANVDDTAEIAVELTDADVIQGGSITWNEYRPISEQYQQVSGKFVDPSPNSLFQLNGYPPVRDANYEQLTGLKRRKTQDFEVVQDVLLAQKLARLLLNMGQYQAEFAAPFMYRALRAQAWSIVRYTSERFGWVKLFRVYRHDLATTGIEMLLREVHPSIWSAGSVTQPIAPSAGVKYDPRQEIVLSGLAVDLALVQAEGANGDIADALKVRWDAPPANVRRTETRYRVIGNTSWETGTPVEGSETGVVLAPVMKTSRYEVQARHISIHEVPGPWVGLAGYVTSGSAGNVNYQGIIEAGVTAQWPYVGDPMGTRPENNATYGAPGNSPVGNTTANNLVGTVNGNVTTLSQHTYQLSEITTSLSDLEDIYGDTQSAADSAAAAAASVSAAQSYASNAAAAQANAEAARDAAAGARDAAAGARADALSAAQASAGYRDTASGYASTASQKADAAAGSASAAQGSASTATTKAQDAAGSALSAQGSASTASGAASSAGTSASAASSSAVAANFTAAQIFPSDFQLEGKVWTTQYDGDTTANPDALGYFPTVDGIGKVFQAEGFRLLSPKGRLPVVPGRKYRFTAKFRVVTDATNGVNTNIYIHTALFYTAGNVYTGQYSPYSPRVISSADGWQTLTSDYTLPDNGAATFRPAAAFGTNGSNAVVQVAFAKIEDITESSNSADSAAAASLSASSASISKSGADSAAAAATEAKNLAQTARGQAETFASQAASSRDSAAGSASTASTQAGIATTSRNQAEGFKNDAAGSASAAVGSANNAGSSATNAANSASAASASQTAAQAVFNQTRPRIFDPIGRQAYLFQVPPSVFDGPDPANYWPVAYLATWYADKQLNGEWSVSYKSLLPRIAGQRWRFSLYVYSYAKNAQFDLCIADANTETGGNGRFLATLASVIPQNTGFNRMTMEFEASAAWQTFISPYLRIVSSNGQPINATIHVTGFELEDITESTRAGGQASAAASSASLASASATAAGQSATASQNSNIAAGTSAGQASSSASQAASSASGAAGSASAASSSAVLAANVGSNSRNPNATFANYPDPAGLPPGYNFWVGGQNNQGTISRVQGLISPYALRMDAWAGQSYGIMTIVPGIASPGAIVVEAVVGFLGGDWSGSGLHCHAFTDTDAPNGEYYNMRFAEQVPAPTPGKTYTITKLMTFSSTAPKMGFYIMGHYDGMGSIASGVGFVLHRATIRQATASEIAAGRADTNASAALAQISTEASTRASETGSLASRAQTLEARSSGGGNIIGNSEFNTPGKFDGWVGYGNMYSFNRAFGFDLNGPYPDYVIPTQNVVWAMNNEGEGAFGIQCPTLPVQAGKFYEASMYIAAHRRRVAVRIQWFDWAGNYLGQTAMADYMWPGSGGRALGQQSDAPYIGPGNPYTGYTRLAIKGQAPANAALASFFMDADVVLAGQGNGYIWFCQPQLAEVKSLTGDPLAYTPGVKGSLNNALARVTTTESVVATLSARKGFWNVTAGAGNESAFIEASAEVSPGVNTSDVAIGARRIAMYNMVNGSYVNALTMAGGNAIFTGGINAGAYIRLGSGDGWPVALRSKDFSVSDGDVVNFGANLGGLPAYTFAGNNLAPLNSGETYQLYVENITATGFTARLKISTPATPTNYNKTDSYQSGSGPQFQMDKNALGDSADGTYRILASGSITSNPSYIEYDGQQQQL